VTYHLIVYSTFSERAVYRSKWR